MIPEKRGHLIDLGDFRVDRMQLPHERSTLRRQDASSALQKLIDSFIGHATRFFAKTGSPFWGPHFHIYSRSWCVSIGVPAKCPWTVFDPSHLIKAWRDRPFVRDGIPHFFRLSHCINLDNWLFRL